MRPPNRGLLIALAASAALHLSLIAGTPEFDVTPPIEPSGVPLEARLLPPPPPPPPPVAVAPRDEPPPPSRARKARPRPAPAVVMAAPDAPVVATLPMNPPADIHPAEVDVAGSAPTPTPAPEPALSEAPTPSAAPPPLPAEYPIRKVRLVYDLLHSESQTRVGNVVHTFTTDGQRYEAEAVAQAVGFVSLVFRGRFVQRSRGVIGPDGLVPEEYTLERGRGDPPERAVFDWEEGTLDLAWRNERRTVDLPPGAQDAISILHQLYFMRPLPDSTTLTIATGRKLGRYVYAVRGDEDLITPMGLIRTMHVARVEADGSVLDVWLDRDRNLLPVKIYSVDRTGTVLEQVVREVALLE